MSRGVEPLAAVIDQDSNTISIPIDLGERIIVAIQFTAQWTPAVLTFQASRALGAAYRDVYLDTDTEVSVPAAGGKIITLGKTLKHALWPYRFIKIRSGTSALPVSQAVARTLILHIEDAIPAFLIDLLPAYT